MQYSGRPILSYDDKLMEGDKMAQQEALHVEKGCASSFCDELGTAGRSTFPNVGSRRTAGAKQGGSRTGRTGGRSRWRRSGLVSLTLSTKPNPAGSDKASRRLLLAQ